MSKKRPVPRLVTIGVIANELRVPVTRVERLLRSRPHIQPRAYANHTRLFDNGAIAQVRSELHAIDAKQQGRRGGAP